MNPFKDDTENVQLPALLDFEGTSATQALSSQWSQTGCGTYWHNWDGPKREN